MQKSGETAVVEGSAEVSGQSSGEGMPLQQYAEARKQAIADFEKKYVHDLLQANEGNVSQSARSAGMDRVYLHRLIRRYGLNK